MGRRSRFEDEADEAGQVSSATEKSKEDPIKKAITIKLDDLPGNTFVEFLGSMSHSSGRSRRNLREVTEADGEGAGDTNEEIYKSMRVCSRCARPLIIRMKSVSIPYFQATLMVSTNCKHCGYRDNEVKSGAANSEKGKRATLRIEDREDLSRHILKSESMWPDDTRDRSGPVVGTLGGRSTIVEGFSERVYELSEKVYTVGDSSTMVDEDRQKFQNFLKRSEEITNAEEPSTLPLDDPLAKSYLQNLYVPDLDLNIEIVTYESGNYIAEDVYEPKEGKRFEKVAS